jgi:hypothetical protein
VIYRIEFELEATPEQVQAIREQITHSRVWYDRLEEFFRERFQVIVKVRTGSFTSSTGDLAQARRRSLQ